MKQVSKNGTYASWQAMKTRCDNPMADNYERYGGSGITYTPRWAYYDNFLMDMGERPAGLTLDRRDNSKGYCKENCQWATRREQSYNRDTTKLSEEAVAAIRKLLAQGSLTHSVIATRYAVSRPTISLIAANKTWVEGVS